MIIVQTPLRVSLFGGGTDFPSYYLQEGGCVLTTAIDKFIFVTIKERFDRKLRVGWTKTEMVDSLDELQHELIREAFRKTGIVEGIEITTMGDIPSEGSGLGSSATVTVGALHAMYSLYGQLITAEKLAQEACEIEIDILDKPSGVQDQYIAAYGGLRFFEFTTDGAVKSQRIVLGNGLRKKLNENTMLFFTGVTRRSSSVLTEQKENIRDRSSILTEMKKIAHIACDELQNGNIDALGELLHEGWQLKKQLASQISNGMIDNIYYAARKAGAIGGKISGAGGGGFLLLYCPHSKQDAVREALSSLQELPFKMEPDGSKVIFNYLRA
ncbi:MAG: GHMP kinase [Chloroflexi bacterium]|nr:GHMP kinase [Chloroflexota bacterium]